MELDDINTKQCLKFLHSVANFDNNHRIKQQMYNIWGNRELQKSSIFWKKTIDLFENMCRVLEMNSDDFFNMSVHQCKKNNQKIHLYFTTK